MRNKFSESPCALWRTPATRKGHNTWARRVIEQFSFLNSIWIRAPCLPGHPPPPPTRLALTTPPGHVGLVPAPEMCSSPFFCSGVCTCYRISPLQSFRQTADPFLSLRSVPVPCAPTSHTPHHRAADLPCGTWQVLSSSWPLATCSYRSSGTHSKIHMAGFRLTFKSRWPLNCL